MLQQTFYSFAINYFKDRQLSEQLLPIARKFLSDPSKLTNEWDYKNTYTRDSGIADEPELKFFVDIILKASREYIENKSLKLIKTTDLWVSMFCSEMHEGDYHDAHTHPGALFSGLIYLEVPEGSSNLEFSTPRGQNPSWKTFLEISPTENIFEVDQLPHTIIVKPEPGLFLFWESWALHRVPTNNSIGPRITMVFNVGVERA
jgi:uncharacterized protein (TIGR02466 family)